LPLFFNVSSTFFLVPIEFSRFDLHYSCGKFEIKKITDKPFALDQKDRLEVFAEEQGGMDA